MGVTANHSLTILSKDASTNTAQVRYLVQITTSGDSWQGYVQTGNFNIDGVPYTNQYTLPKNSITTVFDKTVTISNASGKTVTASYSCYTTPTFGTLEGETSVDIDLPRYANFTEHYVKSIGLNSIIVKWNADAYIDLVQYSLNNEEWIDTSGLEYTINNLSPNKNYDIRTRIRSRDSQLWTESSVITATTQDIARITSVESFNHGDNANIVITNPSRK